MFFHLFAFSIFASFASFIIGYLCWMGSLNQMESVCFLGGMFFLFLTHATLGLALCLYFLKRIHVHARGYFGVTATLERKVLAKRIRQSTLFMQYRLERQQLHYRCEYERLRLSAINHKKHMRQLTKAIQLEFNAVSHRISCQRLRSLRKNLRNCFRTGDIEGLVALHREIQSIH